MIPNAIVRCKCKWVLPKIAKREVDMIYWAWKDKEINPE